MSSKLLDTVHCLEVESEEEAIAASTSLRFELRAHLTRPPVTCNSFPLRYTLSRSPSKLLPHFTLNTNQIKFPTHTNTIPASTRHSALKPIMRGNAAQTKVHFKGTEDDFIVFVESAEDVKKWKADKTIPMAQVVSGFKVFITHK